MKRICIAATFIAALMATGTTAVDAIAGADHAGPRAHTAILAGDTAWGGGCDPKCKEGNG